MILEIGLKPGEVPLRLPVIVQNFSAGLLTLKVTESFAWVDWDTVSGHESWLRLPATGSGAGEAITGKVSWIKQPGQEGAAVFLGMQLSQPTLQVQKFLEDEVLHTPKDIKGLWQQWDRIQVKSRRSAAAGWIALFFGLVLLAAGGGMAAAPGRFPPPYAYGFLAAGGILTLVAAVWTWRQHRI